MPRWRACTRHTIWSIPWALPDHLKKKIGKPRINFAKAAHQANVQRIIYLGGLGEGALSPHLRSRQEVGEALNTTGVEVIEFRASIVIGSGSLSFEIIRALVERLPVMICPAWVSIAAQPIGIEDLVSYLVEALDLPESGRRIIEIGGADQVSYEDIMREYARQRNLRRLMISVPVLTPRLSSLWLGLVTPVYARIGRKLIDSIRNPTVVRDPSALQLFSVRPKGVREIIARAIVNEDREFAATKWSDALSSRGEESSWGGVRFGNRIVDSQGSVGELFCGNRISADSPHRRRNRLVLWRLVVASCGAFWIYCWAVSVFVGDGVIPNMLQVGDTLDFWRVEAFENNQRLLLAAEMKLPGRAWLEFAVEDKGKTLVDSPNCDLRSHRCRRIDVLVCVVSGAQVDVRKDVACHRRGMPVTRKPKPNENTGFYSQRSQANRSPCRAA